MQVDRRNSATIGRGAKMWNLHGGTFLVLLLLQISLTRLLLVVVLGVMTQDSRQLRFLIANVDVSQLSEVVLLRLQL